MGSTFGDTPLCTYIDLAASHPTALSLPYTTHPPYVIGQVIRRTSYNTLSPPWATPGALSAATTPVASSLLRFTPAPDLLLRFVEDDFLCGITVIVGVGVRQKFRSLSSR